MRNLDLSQQKKMEIMQKLTKATAEANDAAFAQAFGELTDLIQEAVMDEAKGLIQAADSAVLNGRGVRQLTTEENTYYQKVIDAMRTSNPKQALTDLDVVLPKTVIDAVFEDLIQDHPLLRYIDFQNTSGLIEFMLNTNGTQKATWGPLVGAITKELSSGFKKVSLTLNKLSAFIPVAKSMLDLGPKWLDRFLRSILFEAIANGLEEAAVTGTGKDMPIGMDRQVGTGVTVVDGVYPQKEAIKILSLDPVTYGNLIASMALDANGKPRNITKVMMLVNPIDYLKKVMPATTVRTADGRYANDVFAFPTDPIQSIHMPEGKAIIGLPKRYFMGIGTSKEGKIEYDDSFKFLDDERVYLIKLYGHGEPLDNNAFVVVDITDLKPSANQVFITNPEGAPVPVYYPIFDARLSGVTVGALDLSPEFNKSIFYYEVATSNATNVITATALVEDATIEILVNDAAHTNGTAATWTTGENIVSISVTSGTETETYTLVVTKS
jgi:HK97 family phage major capsid protein